VPPGILEVECDARLRGVQTEDSFGSHERAGCGWFWNTPGLGLMAK
jgi:hypothetical protein